MACLNITGIRKCSSVLFYFRYQLHSRRFSTSKLMLCDKSPIKYSSSAVSQIKISEMIGLQNESNKLKPWYEPYVVGASILVFFIYFCIIREENDVDDIIKGNPKTDSIKNLYLELINLKTKLKYCEMNKLPTSALKAQIQELEEKCNLEKNNFKL